MVNQPTSINFNALDIKGKIEVTQMFVMFDILSLFSEFMRFYLLMSQGWAELSSGTQTSRFADN